MKTFGDQLREARERRGVSPSEAATATRIKIQIIQDLEANRLQRTYAPIYAKGFIRIYGEYLGLDVTALLSDYENQRPTGVREPAAPRMKPAPPASTSALHQPKRAPRGARLRNALRDAYGSIAHRVRHIRPPAWRKRFLDRVQAITASLARKTRKPPAPDTTAPAPASRQASLRERLHNAIRGPYRYHAAVAVIIVLLLILTMILSSAIRRQATPEDEIGAPPVAPRIVDDEPAMEFTHEPPPPYYR